MGNTLQRVVYNERDRIDSRRARLFLCACVRAMPSREHSSFLPAVELAERMAQGRATDAEVQSMRYTYRHRYTHPADMLLRPVRVDVHDLLQRGLVWLEAFAPSATDQAHRLALWHDLTGGQGVVIPPLLPAWEGGTVMRLAEGILAGRHFDHLPILGDALEEAGCSDAAIFDHCRAPQPHALGCWLLDALTGR